VNFSLFEPWFTTQHFFIRLAILYNDIHLPARTTGSPEAPQGSSVLRTLPSNRHSWENHRGTDTRRRRCAILIGADGYSTADFLVPEEESWAGGDSFSPDGIESDSGIAAEAAEQLSGQGERLELKCMTTRFPE
jgi:hypothetical protein